MLVLLRIIIVFETFYTGHLLAIVGVNLNFARCNIAMQQLYTNFIITAVYIRVDICVLHKFSFYRAVQEF